jgi:uncharacterized protein YtpQ (UPF0354 family)
MRANLLPVLRSSASLELKTQQSLAEGRGGLLIEDFLADMKLAFVIDTPDTFHFVTEPDLRKLGLATAEVRSLAISNLRKQTGKVIERHPLAELFPALAPDATAGVFVAGSNDNLNSGRLLLHELWAPLAKSVHPGKLLVHVATRSMVVCCASIKDDTIRAKKVGDLYAAREERVSSNFLVFQEDGWKTAELPFAFP